MELNIRKITGKSEPSINVTKKHMLHSDGSAIYYQVTGKGDASDIIATFRIDRIDLEEMLALTTK